MRGVAAAAMFSLALASSIGSINGSAHAQAPASTEVEDGVEVRSFIWARPADLELHATLYRPKDAPGPLPALVDIHGGAWGAGDRNADHYYCVELAKSGLAVFSIDFRQSPAFKHPASSADVTAAVRYVRLNAKALHADPNRIGLIGSSSGAHLALLAALRPDAPQHLGTPIAGPDGVVAPHDDILADVDYVVAMWPVSDPAARYRYAKRAGIDRLVELTERYFPDAAAMWDASIQRIVTSGEAGLLPPILIIQPGDDSNIPQDMTLDLIRAWQARGGRLDYAFYPGQPHAFGHRPSAATSDLIRTVADYIRRQNAPD
ncbi:MAG: alpha/beta hydrolase [Hyphomonadaceae bacterium]